MIGGAIRRACVPALGVGLAIAIMVGLADLAGYPYAAVPFVTSIVLVLAAPASPQAQPRNIIGGHIISALAGIGVLAIAGPSGWAAAVAVGLAAGAMTGTRTLHPPAGINAFMIVTQHQHWHVLISPVATGAVLLTAYAWLFHRATRTEPWPLRPSS